MITQAVIGLFLLVARGAVALLPNGNPPAWIGTGAGQLSAVFSKVAGLGAWLPLSLLLQVAGAVLACLLLGLGIKVGRMVLSLFTGGGGSAA